VVTALAEAPRFRCWAGWRITLGQWAGMPPCTMAAQHRINFPTDMGLFMVYLCEDHFVQVNAAGLVARLDPGYQQ
jgi:hypothetical protein